MSAFDDDFGDEFSPEEVGAVEGGRSLKTPDPSRGQQFTDLTLQEIQCEILELYEQADRGIPIDEKRFDWLLQAQEHNEDYQEELESERLHWQESIQEFTDQCLERTRTFVPPDIFHCSLELLIGLGISEELGRRLLQRQCLWLVRMSKEEICRLHESDLLGRFNSVQQNLDIIETAAVYASLPDHFPFDPQGKKKAWRDNIEENLRQMLLDNDNDTLPAFKIRNPVYEGLQFGPIEDVVTVRRVDIVIGDRPDMVRRKSHVEVCQQSSILARMRSINRMKDAEEQQNVSIVEDGVEQEDSAEEEVLVQEEGHPTETN